MRRRTASTPQSGIASTSTRSARPRANAIARSSSAANCVRYSSSARPRYWLLTPISRLTKVMRRRVARRRSRQSSSSVVQPVVAMTRDRPARCPSRAARAASCIGQRVVGGDAFADRVAVAQREVAQRVARRRRRVIGVRRTPCARLRRRPRRGVAARVARDATARGRCARTPRAARRPRAAASRGNGCGRRVEARARHDQHVFLLEQSAARTRGRRSRARRRRRRRGSRTARRAAPPATGARWPRSSRSARGASSCRRPPGAHSAPIVSCAMQRLLDRELPGHVRAQAQRAEQVHRVVEIAAWRADRRRAPPSRRASRRRDAPSTGRRTTGTACRRRAAPAARTLGAVVERCRRRSRRPSAAARAARRWRRCVRAARADTPRRSGLFGLISTMARVRGVTSASISSGSGRKPFSGAAAVIHRPAVVEDGRRRPQRIVGRRQQHLVARIEQRAQRQVDQFADAVADEHALGRRIGRAARGAGSAAIASRAAGRPCWCVYGSVCAMLVGDRALQVLRRAEPEGAGIADVELDQRAALGFEFAGASGQFTADLVADFGQAFAGLQAGRRTFGACGGGGAPA